jgi:hypothetical protein
VARTPASRPTPDALHQGSIRRWTNVDGLLGEPEEQHPAVARPASIESEYELVQIIVEMGGADGAP